MDEFTHYTGNYVEDFSHFTGNFDPNSFTHESGSFFTFKNVIDSFVTFIVDMGEVPFVIAEFVKLHPILYMAISFSITLTLVIGLIKLISGAIT